MRRSMATAIVVIATAVAACGGAADAVIDPGDGGEYSVRLDPSDFVDRIDNPWLPMLPGSRWVYEGGEGDELERIEVVVTDQTRLIQGVTATVVRDTVTVGGSLVEDTYDWFAQDRDGNVWYLGEDSTEYEDGQPVSTAGSWEAGVDGASAGIVMQAEPQVGDAYRQEFYAGEAEDMAEVIRVGAVETVAAGTFEDLLVTREWTPLEPDAVEEKSYARGVGMVLERAVEGGSERAELIEFDLGG